MNKEILPGGEELNAESSAQQKDALVKAASEGFAPDQTLAMLVAVAAGAQSRW